MHIYIFIYTRMDYAHSYISKYICTHVYTHSEVCWRHTTQRGVISRARTGEGRDIRDLSRRYVSFIFVYVPTLVYSGVVGRPREEARRDISPEREISRRSRSRVVINATQLLLTNHYVRKRDASEIAIPRGPPWVASKFRLGAKENVDLIRE